ncbi:MAG: hypothetical protein IAE90_05395 [Ignavibacteria bacterium]|nr:hypothetical protein [Ignavibacteria bacterium]
MKHLCALAVVSLAVVSLFFVTGLKAQDSSYLSADRIYLKAGYQYTFRSGSGSVRKDRTKYFGTAVSPEGWVDVFTAGVGFKLSPKIYLETTYEYMKGVGFQSEESRVYNGHPSNGEEYPLYSVNNFYKSHDLTARALVFVHNDRRVNPIYFISGLTLSVQPVHNIFTDRYEDRTEIFDQNYTRLLAGPVAGVGVFWETGFIKFATELTIGSRFSLGKKELSETTINFSISPIIGP